MNIEVIKMLKGKMDEGVFTLEQIKMICPDYEKETEVLELLDNPFIQEYNRLLAEVQEHLTIPDVQRYVELTTVKTKVAGHTGTKNPMPCLVCGNDSHHASWGEAKIDGVDYHIGTLKQACPNVPTETRFRIPKNLTIDEMAELKFPFSKGQLGGRYKEDNTK